MNPNPTIHSETNSRSKSLVNFHEVRQTIFESATIQGVQMNWTQATEITAQVLAGKRFEEIKSLVNRNIQVIVDEVLLNPYTALNHAFNALRSLHNVKELTVIESAYVLDDCAELSSCQITFSEQDLRNWLDMILLQGPRAFSPTVHFDDETFNSNVNINTHNNTEFQCNVLIIGSSQKYTDVHAKCVDIYLGTLFRDVIMPLASIQTNTCLESQNFKPLSHYCDIRDVESSRIEAHLQLEPGQASAVFASEEVVNSIFNACLDSVTE